MPGSTTFFGPTAEDNEIVKKSESNLMSSRQPPPVAPRTTSVSIQSWQSATSGSESNYGDNRHARSASMDSLESSGSSSSGGGSSIANQQSTTIEYIPTRTAGKVSKLPTHNPLQFVKVQSPLYKKAEQQIKLTKEVKITREALKEGEEEWQSNLDNWKSRRRKVSEKVIQRAEEMRQIEAEEQLRQDQYLQQQRKIKKFSEIVEKRSSRSYNLDLYIGQGNDSGLGGTPEPDDTIDSHNSILRSDTSEGMTSEAESIDSDIHKSDKMHEKEPPKVPQKPQMRLKKERTVEGFDNSITSTNHHFTSHLPNRDFDNFSSTEPSDVEGHTGDSETVSSEEDISYLADGRGHKSESTIISSLSEQKQENCSINNGISKENTSSIEHHELAEKGRKMMLAETDYQLAGWQKHSFSICIKPGDNRGFGFTLKGGKDQGCSAYIDCVTKYSPADTSGIKEGDKIISLNGELAADYSHASLIFSVKQAVYTGILDLVVYRPEENAPVLSEIKKPTNRKSSFAEKLALFSSGVNSTPNPEESKAITSSKSNEGKSESLVLRRRSAFENGKKENVVHRRSSCLSQGISKSNAENLEKRLSVDLSQYNLSENGTVKKGPPPPVPVKPKLKPKTSNDSPKTDFVKTNGYNDEEHSNTNGFTHTSNDIPSNDDILGSHSDTEFSSKAGNEIHLQELKLENDHKLSSDSFLNQELNEDTGDVQLSSYIEQDNSLSPTNNSTEILNGSHTETENIENEMRGLSLNEISIPPPFDDFHTSNTKNEELNSKSEFETKVFSNDEQTMKSESLISVSFTSSKQFHENIKSVRETDPSKELDEDDLLSDVTEHKSCFNEQNNSFNNDSLQTNICHVPVPHNFEEPIDSSDFSTIMNDIRLTDNEEVTEGDRFKNEDNFCLTEGKSLSPVDDSDENVNNTQVNSSPLCLPLEKIDEDDVISASTTTSSETPDTETVIETLPSNLSPLPNDESNGEESSKPLDCQEKDVEYVAETSAPSFEAPESNCLDNPEYITEFDNVPFQNEFSCTTSEGYIIENIYPDEEDDEYCRELDESIDQITSLDVIDEIEQQLMHQLEQQGEAFEEMDEGLTAQLEQDINKQWLYFSDETELLDDLTPRNLEPPKEPPPPPPPPELDAADQKILPIMTRTNSTKRIKKELWRRRSDFLGLESPEGIDVDKILPPPPALEEILKQEREQTQWLEKRLSLAETDISAPLYTNDSMSMESQDISQSDYSEYFLEDPDVSEVSVEDINEQWKENSVEQSVFEASELQYAPPSDVTIPVSDESQKINESPQHKAKQNLHNLGAAPKAKIMDSNKWITERVTSVSKKPVEPVFRQATYNQNYWLTQDERKRNIQISDNVADRRYSMPPCQNSHPDVTVRTWGDREYEFQKQRPRSAVWNSPPVAGDMYDSYSHKQDILRTHSLDGHREVNCDSNTFEPEVHKCSCCGKGLCEGSAMGIEALRLYFHIECFRCCVCRMQLGNGSCGTDVQVKHDQLYCPNCFTVD